MDHSFNHDWLVNKIFHSPYYIDVRNVSAKMREYVMMYDGNYLTIPDIYFKNSRDIFVEVKSSNSPRLYDKGMIQLEKMLFWHEFQELPEPEVRLITPRFNRGKHEMLRELNEYRVGDRYDTPTKVHYPLNIPYRKIYK